MNQKIYTKSIKTKYTYKILKSLNKFDIICWTRIHKKNDHIVP